MKKFLFVALVIFTLLIITACSATTENSNKTANKQAASSESAASESPKILRGPNVTLVAEKGTQKLSNGVTVPVWTFNGSAPGPEIHVQKGQKVRVTLKNELSAPVSIHWHGYPVPNKMDGIPGVTQNAVAPGKSFTYEFVADKAGTYWYHSHQDSVNQVDRGLYGAFIVEDPKEKYDKDYTLMLDEWVTDKNQINSQIKAMTPAGQSNKNNGDSGMGSMPGMDMGGSDQGSSNSGGSSGMNMDNMDNSSSDSGNSNGMNMPGNMMADNMSMYDLYTINGKSGSLVKPLTVNKGDNVRLRFINAGYLPHNIHIHGHNIKVIATDGQPINNPQAVKNQVISIAPGERYDVAFTADNPGKWYIEDHGTAKGTNGMKALIDYEGSKATTDQPNASTQLPAINFADYGSKTKPEFTLNQKYDVTYTMNLNAGMNNNGMIYTINGKTFPNTDPIKVKTGDRVKVKLVNRDHMNNHPMHLHGHFFQVLSKNGKPVNGSPIYKDTLNVKPGETYEVAFLADNPGNWLFHCHDLHHANAGMITEVQYTDFHSSYVPSSSSNNKPE
ncbi:multicopper oxidase family protein [Sporolactobacillus inulinus]|uniref:Multicopper oxidase n=2 Tax=Sporolactobacillus inulinus TaxID=2078 RepID=A0A4Y1ZCL5_9BACL|nr:multicopper oxidase family protein [Sporolactobacillus inulinus]KLI01995.1 copper oxidase [Sporolactobacillus inulinus CASD]GAY76769.1 multicopper oxidase [Sporolactobacillus inulinus]GEB78541.1 copper oxidase [Sporolactobacillus inulinus]